MTASSSPRPCPICRCERHTELDLFPVRDLCSVYRRRLGVDVAAEFPPGVSDFRLLQCNQCGLQFFDPACAGSADFYTAMSSGRQEYYSSDRWEFAQARHRIPANAAVLDIGCGDGQFLSQLPHKEKLGLEFTPAAAAKARARGLNVSEHRMEDIASESFDAITVFHVLEHLISPLEFLQETVRVLRPKGLLIISVPNNGAWIGSDLQHAANAPPHHTLRWRGEAFRFLPKILSLDLVQLTSEPLSPGYVGLYRRVQCLKWIERALGRRLPLMRLTPATRIASKLASLWIRLAGSEMPKTASVPDGFSLLAVFQKRGSHAPLK